MFDRMKRYILYILFRMLRVDIDFQRKCKYCFNERTWQTKGGELVCDKHNILVKRRKK